ncbi:MAG TPA: ATP-binding protein [Ktedonobacterales bacterium]
MMSRDSDKERVSARRMQSRLRETTVGLPRLRWPRWLGGGADVADPSAAMFQRIRGQMTLLYAAILAVTLLFAGTVLYLAVQQTVHAEILDPAQDSLDPAIAHLTSDWLNLQDNTSSIGQTSCPIGGPDSGRIVYACFDAHGAFSQESNYAANILPPSFTNNSLALTALRAPCGCAYDTLSVGRDGDVLREARIVTDPASGQTLGVIQVGAPVGHTIDQLHALLALLLIVGAITIVVSAVGGFILSRRALLPARLAYARQQQFIGDVSHELRTPLTLLRADAEMLLRGRANLPPDDAELLDDMVDETARLASLTSSLLTLARLDSSNRLPERETCDLAEVATQVARRTAAFAAERGVTVSAVTQPGLLVSGVRDLLDQAALILVDNAIKYSPRGTAVEARAERRGDHAALIVRDQGPGVAPEHLQHLGERFYRPDKARARQSGQDGGAGLGISIARGVAALHQGTLTFASAPGQGLTATLELPAARLRPAAMHAETPPMHEAPLQDAEAQQPQDTASR